MPRLSIKHLLLWMTFSSMLASISHLKGYSPPMSVAYLLGSLINSGALTVTAVVLYTCIRQSRWNLLQPGHWFAFVATWGIIDGIAVMPLCVWLAPNYKGYIYCIAFIGMAAVYFVGAVTGSWKRYWKLALALLALDMVSATSWRLFQEWWGWPGTAEFIYTRIHPVLGTVAFLATVISISADLYRKHYRDWLHWIGIAWFVLVWYGTIRAYVIPYLL